MSRVARVLVGAVATVVGSIAACSSFESADTPATANDAAVANETSNDGDGGGTGPTGDGGPAPPKAIWIFGGEKVPPGESVPQLTTKTFRAELDDKGDLGPWQEVPNLTMSRIGAVFVSPAPGAVVAAGGTLQATGGTSGQTVEQGRFDQTPPTFSAAPPLTEALARGGGVAEQGVVFVAGGIPPAGGAYSNTLIAATYDANGGGIGPWTAIGKLPHQAIGPMAYVGNRFYWLPGGTDNIDARFDDAVFADRYADGGLGPWSDAGRGPLHDGPETVGTSLVVSSGRLVAIGGAGPSPTNVPLTTVYVGTPQSDGMVTWVESTPLGVPRTFGCAVVVDQDIYVLGGASSDGASTSDVVRGRLQSNGAIPWQPQTPMPEGRDSFGCAVY